MKKIENPMLDQVETCGCVGNIGKTRLYQLIKNEGFPPGIKIGGGARVGWLASDVQNWIDAMAKKQSAAK